MKQKSFFVAVLLAVAVAASAQIKNAYVCQPCGLPCDEEIHAKPGTCTLCQMPLVDRSTVKFTNLTPKEFCARIAENPDAIILDVRAPGEFSGTNTSVETYGYFKKAINININQLTKRLGEINQYKDKEILVYCSQNHRSPRAAYYLGLQGFNNIKNMSGGLSKAGDAMKSSCFKAHFVPHKK